MFHTNLKKDTILVSLVSGIRIILTEDMKNDGANYYRIKKDDTKDKRVASGFSAVLKKDVWKIERIK